MGKVDVMKRIIETYGEDCEIKHLHFANKAAIGWVEIDCSPIIVYDKKKLLKAIKKYYGCKSIKEADDCLCHDSRFWGRDILIINK